MTAAAPASSQPASVERCRAFTATSAIVPMTAETALQVETARVRSLRWNSFWKIAMTSVTENGRNDPADQHRE